MTRTYSVKNFTFFFNKSLYIYKYLLRITVFLFFVNFLVLWKLENTAFRELDLFPSSGKVGETPTVLCRLEIANLIYWTTTVRSNTAI
jgi:hypothetical protein